MSAPNRSISLALACACSLALASCEGQAEGRNADPRIRLAGGDVSELTLLVGETTVIEVFATDDDGDPVEIEFEYEADIATATIDQARLTQAGGQATLIWAPSVGDVTGEQTRIRLLFVAIDGRGGRGERVLDLRVIPGNGAPAFESPASQRWQNCCEAPLEFRVWVKDSDSESVALEMVEGPPGAEFIEVDGLSGYFRWQTDGQRPAKSRYRAIFRADDGQNPPVTQQVAILIPPARDPTDVIGAPEDGEDAWSCETRGMIEHTPPGPQSGEAATIPLTIDLTSEARAIYEEISLFPGHFDPGAPAGEREVYGFPIEVPAQGGRVELENIAAKVGRSVTMFYQICLYDDDAEGEDAIHCEPAGLDLYYQFDVLIDDQECVEDWGDGEGQAGSDAQDDDPARASDALMRRDWWSRFRVCERDPDFHAIDLSAKETVRVIVGHDAIYDPPEVILLDQDEQPLAESALVRGACGLGYTYADLEGGQGASRYTLGVAGVGAYTIGAFSIEAE